jgi:predicted AlkP superfamily phosphohydrolase/phosphomutase
MKKETAVEWIESYLLKFNDISNNLRIRKAFEQAKEMEEKQQGYSEQEMLGFSEWVSHNDWVYLPSKSYWVNEEQEELEENFTTKELFEQFKQQEQ